MQTVLDISSEQLLSLFSQLPGHHLKHQDQHYRTPQEQGNKGVRKQIQSDPYCRRLLYGLT